MAASDMTGWTVTQKSSGNYVTVLQTNNTRNYNIKAEQTFEAGTVEIPLTTEMSKGRNPLVVIVPVSD